MKLTQVEQQTRTFVAQIFNLLPRRTPTNREHARNGVRFGQPQSDGQASLWRGDCRAQIRPPTAAVPRSPDALAAVSRRLASLASVLPLRKAGDPTDYEPALRVEARSPIASPTYLVIITGLVFAGLLPLAASRANAVEAKAGRSVSTSKSVVVNTYTDSDNDVSVKVETKDGDDEAKPAKDRPWLGVSVDEASEALSEQLGLDAGVGLVITHVSADSPAGKAGLKKNDVLAQLGGQALVHPAQLRKLVRARKPGDKVELVIYRGGKKQSETVTLEKAPARFGLFDDSGKSGEDWENFNHAFNYAFEWPGAAAGAVARAQSKALQEALSKVQGVQKEQIEAEIKRGMEQARKAIEEAARELEHNKGSLQKEGARLKELLKSGVSVDDNATVVVRSKGKASRTLVKTDENGTIILIGPPNLRLTARDKDGKLLFDGEIETDEQRAKVPKRVWERVEPMIEKEGLEKAEAEKSESDSKR